MIPINQLRFSSFKIKNQVFYRTSLSVGIVNLKPLVPGHVLVIPTRVVPRFNDLTPQEVTDLFASVQTISKVIEQEYSAPSLSIAIQDGALAGQSVPHVHVHILPRHHGDFVPPDAMYDALDKFEYERETRETREERKLKRGVDDEERTARSREEMKEEAQRLALLFEEERRGSFEEW